MRPEDIINLLNEMLRMDQAATTVLFTSYVPCNERLANHPTITVQNAKGPNERPQFVLNSLGVLNAIIAAWQDANRVRRTRIGARVDRNTQLIVAFQLVDPKAIRDEHVKPIMEEFSDPA